MKTVAIVVIVLVVLLVIALVVLAGRRNKRRAALRERFGPEYDLAVKRGKDRRTVEQRLEALAQQRDGLEIRDVAPQEHVRLGREWDSAQARFVDDPGQAVADADGLVNSVLRSRGYPVENFDDRAALVATDHQDVVESYRSAHDTFAAHLQGGSGDTEQLRQAFLRYREVFGRLNVPAGGDADGDRAVQAAPERRAVEAAPAAPEAQAPPLPAEPVAAEPGRADQFEERPVEPVLAAPIERGAAPAGAGQRDENEAVAADSAPSASSEGGPEANGAQPEGTTRPERPVGAHRADPS
jgi:hypothetical protein